MPGFTGILNYLSIILSEIIVFGEDFLFWLDPPARQTTAHSGEQHPCSAPELRQVWVILRVSSFRINKSVIGHGAES